MTIDLAALSIEPEPIDVYHALLDAGRTLASIADPNADLYNHSAEIEAIARELKSAAYTLHSQAERADRLYDGTVADAGYTSASYALARRDRAEDEKCTRAAAVRACKRQLVALAQIINEMEAKPCISL